MVHNVSVRILEGGVLVVCPYIASQFDADSAFTVSAVPTTPVERPVLFNSTVHRRTAAVTLLGVVDFTE
jgi:hypothetical protein